VSGSGAGKNGAAGRLLLFVTGDAPRSRRAREHLSRALREGGAGLPAPQEVDLLHQPEQTAAYGIFATPALLWAPAAGPASVLYGDLSDAAALERFLGDLAPDQDASRRSTR